jgi:hypothetical protein
MQTSIIALTVAFLATTIAAAPAPAQVQVQLANDQSGANANAQVLADGQPKSVKALYGNTSVGRSGSVIASSAQLTAFPQGTFCVIANQGRSTNLNYRQTFADLDGNPDKSVPVNLDTATITCHVY